MKTLITNIKTNEIKLVSGGGLCSCSNENGSERSSMIECANSEECIEACCTKPSSNWEMANFMDNYFKRKRSKTISTHCSRKSTKFELPLYPLSTNKLLIDNLDYYTSSQ